ncbi:MAG: hypothetical protein GXY76_15850 [Chloroflexi bacterium]|nr:hypothetical protein [Chloroflexota bacterium]
MPIDFAPERWERIRENARLWWAGKLGRPLIQLTVAGRDPGRPEPALPPARRTAHYDFSVPAEEVVDRWDYDLSCADYIGDAFPSRFVDFGPGVIAAFLGARTELGEATVWFHAPEERPIAEIHLEHDQSEVWLNRVRGITQAAAGRWQGQVQVGMTDLGGNLDVVSTFRPSHRLLLDLYDAPDEVKRVTWEAHRMWWRYFSEINAILRPSNPGYTCWTPLYSEAPYYMLQCDFCYMISPAMFDEFVKPELVASCKRLGNAFYHLDGVGQLPHLDSLLSIPELKGIQWIYGDGKPDYRHWTHIYRKVREAGKLIQLSGGPEVLEHVAKELGSAEGIALIGSVSASRRDEAEALIAKYG